MCRWTPLCWGFLEGLSPEAIAAECFSTLTLEQVYGTIAYYLAHRPEIDAYLKQADAECEALRQAMHSDAPDFSPQTRRGTAANADGWVMKVRF